MITPATLQFLYELSQNNNRDWFEKNKPRYEREVKRPFEDTLAVIIERVRAFEPGYGPLQPKDCTFRLHRDTRFSLDKTPYKTHLSAVITSRGRKSMEEPGYYLQLEFGKLSLGGGAYFLEKESLRRARTAIAQDPGAFHEQVLTPDFLEKFGEIKGDKNKVLPPEFKEAARSEPLIANKQFYFMAEMDPELSLGPGFPDFAEEHFRAAAPLNAFFRKALS